MGAHRYRPRIAFAMGDPAGISPELAAKLLSLPEIRSSARLVVFGDRRILEEGARVAGTSLDSLIVDQVEGTPLHVTARATNGEVMGLQHETHLTFGVQFHPESILTEHGYGLLKNFLKVAA